MYNTIEKINHCLQKFDLILQASDSAAPAHSGRFDAAQNESPPARINGFSQIVIIPGDSG